MRDSYDVCAIGGGPDALVAAAYLASAGHSVLAVGEQGRPGGVAANVEIAPGFQLPVFPETLPSLDPAVAEDLDLGRHGLDLVAPRPGADRLGTGRRFLCAPPGPRAGATRGRRTLRERRGALSGVRRRGGRIRRFPPEVAGAAPAPARFHTSRRDPPPPSRPSGSGGNGSTGSCARSRWRSPISSTTGSKASRSRRRSRVRSSPAPVSARARPGRPASSCISMLSANPSPSPGSARRAVARRRSAGRSAPRRRPPGSTWNRNREGCAAS